MRKLLLVLVGALLLQHGCIRMSNAGITKLAKLLPLGVPVRIQP